MCEYHTVDTINELKTAACSVALVLARLHAFGAFIVLLTRTCTSLLTQKASHAYITSAISL